MDEFERIQNEADLRAKCDYMRSLFMRAYEAQLARTKELLGQTCPMCSGHGHIAIATGQKDDE